LFVFIGLYPKTNNRTQVINKEKKIKKNFIFGRSISFLRKGNAQIKGLRQIIFILFITLSLKRIIQIIFILINLIQIIKSKT